MQYDLEALQAAHNLARLELDYTQIRAPIDGVVSERYIKIGNTIEVGNPVFRVTSLDPLVAYLHVPERAFRQLAANQTVRIDVDALDGPPVLATVTRVSPVVDAATGTFKLTIEIRDPQARIKTRHVRPHECGLRPSRERLAGATQCNYRARRRNQRVRRRRRRCKTPRHRKPDLATRAWWKYRRDCRGDEQVITIGHVGLKDDAKVEIINNENAG